MDVSYGGENGFNQAIELASDALANVKFIQEKKLIGELRAILATFNMYFYSSQLQRMYTIYNPSFAIDRWSSMCRSVNYFFLESCNHTVYNTVQHKML